MENSNNQVYTEKLMEQISDRMDSVVDTSHDYDDQLKKKAALIPSLSAALEKFGNAQNKELFSQISRTFNVKRFPDIIALLQFPVRLIGGILKAVPRIAAIIIIIVVLFLLYWLIGNN